MQEKAHIANLSKHRFFKDSFPLTHIVICYNIFRVSLKKRNDKKKLVLAHSA